MRLPISGSGLEPMTSKIVTIMLPLWHMAGIKRRVVAGIMGELYCDTCYLLEARLLGAIAV